MNVSRRGLCQTLPFIISALASDSLAQETNNQPIPSFALPFDQMTAHTNGGNTARPILNGITHSGTHLEVHETVLAPGAMPHPPHHHVHEELFLLSKGTIEITSAGKSTTLGPGSAAFVHSGEEHGVHNTGQEPAQYFVVAIGTEA
jgi:mannose-6-phosphate isomerase-like protein (cupin superfamily)